MPTKNSLVPAGLAAGLLCLAAGGTPSASLRAAEAEAPFPPSALRGQVVYQKACAACHGETGDGHGQGAAPLDPKPRDFTTGLYKFRTTTMGELPTDGDLLRVVDIGIPYTQMPGFRHVLTPQERLDVVAYIKNFSPDFAEAEEAPEVVDIPPAPASTAAFVAEGKHVYMALDCWTCHGPAGRGNGPAAKGLKDAWGYPIPPFDLTRPQYKGGADARNIYRTLHTGLNGTPMSAFGGAFAYDRDRVVNAQGLAGAGYSAAEIQALRAYIASQPSPESVRAMDADDKENLTQRRKWALVHYVRSLQRQPGIVQWLFTEDTEQTR